MFVLITLVLLFAVVLGVWKCAMCLDDLRVLLRGIYQALDINQDVVDRIEDGRAVAVAAAVLIADGHSEHLAVERAQRIVQRAHTYMQPGGDAVGFWATRDALESGGL
jgi:hypothetical protein